jgi:NAD+ kinase
MRAERVALVVHPVRPINRPLSTVREWAASSGLDVVQLRPAPSVGREVAPESEVRPGDVVVALGGDGTVLSALRASASAGAPVMGVACGSLGVLTAVDDADVAAALERVGNGDWTPHRLPALAVQPADGPGDWAVNDFVAVRRGAGQLVASVSVDDEVYVRLAGDGLIVSTALGSSGYSMAAGGPVLASDTDGFVFTPLAMHGGNAPPLVVPARSHLRVQLYPGFAGFDIEIDGQTCAAGAIDWTITLEQDKVTLVAFGGPPRRLTALRARRLVADSPRMLARDDRARQAPEAGPQPK